MGASKIEDVRSGLKEAEERRQNYIDNGDSACCEHDLSMGYNSKFNIKLAENHITYFKNKLQELENLTLKKWFSR